jgi:hypothetical protein
MGRVERRAGQDKEKKQSQKPQVCKTDTWGTRKVNSPTLS